MSPLLKQVLEQVGELSAEERLELIQKVVEGLRGTAGLMPKPKWRDLRGMAPYPLVGEDAQSWVSRTRRESDLGRVQPIGEADAG